MVREINLYLAEPRGFCTGVTRAIRIVEKALEDYGAPVFVLNEIVHNKHVVKYLQDRGTVFVTCLNDAPTNRPLIFSAHGVGKNIVEEAKRRGLNYIDATCPLVTKVHSQVVKFEEENSEIIVIGKKNHPEIIGVVGQVNRSKKVHVIDSVEEVKNLEISKDEKIGFVTQTTLCTDDVKEIVEYLYAHFPNLISMKENDICYATTHRQMAVKEVSKDAEMVIVIGSKNSSNSNRLKEVALKNGKDAILIDDASELDWEKIKGYKNIGITAGASAPEELVVELIDAFKVHYEKINIHSVK
jgi:4-hydroxy-3-methylbut-2-enyl diphosphate reductase